MRRAISKGCCVAGPRSLSRNVSRACRCRRVGRDHLHPATRRSRRRPGADHRAGDQASWRYIAFVTAKIRNLNTRQGLRAGLRPVPDAWRVIHPRAPAAGIMAPVGNHSFRLTSITALP